jgi:hypothetical protein
MVTADVGIGVRGIVLVDFYLRVECIDLELQNALILNSRKSSRFRSYLKMTVGQFLPSTTCVP